jgi:hypothetical protein
MSPVLFSFRVVFDTSISYFRLGEMSSYDHLSWRRVDTATNFFTEIMRIPPNIFQREGREKGDERKKVAG